MTRHSVAAVALGVGLVLSAIAEAAPTAQATPGQTPAVEAPPAPPAGPPLSADREAALRDRVKQWYDARRVRDQRAMYDLLEPEYRAKNDFAAYTANTAIRMRFPLQGFEIAAVRGGDGPDTAVASVTLTMDLGRFGSSPVVSDDPWVWRDGQWWAVFKPFEPPFRKPGGF